MMYYALTIRGNLITGVHSSTEPIKQGRFDFNPNLSNDVVVAFDSGEYVSGRDIREYTDGKLRPLVDRILDGLSAVPIGYEIIDGELVKTDAPVNEQPQTIRQRLEEADARIAALEDEIRKMQNSASTPL